MNEYGQGETGGWEHGAGVTRWNRQGQADCPKEQVTAGCKQPLLLHVYENQIVKNLEFNTKANLRLLICQPAAFRTMGYHGQADQYLPFEVVSALK